MVGGALDLVGLRQAADRLYWRLSPLWKKNEELVRPAEFRPVLDRHIAALLASRSPEQFGDYLEFGVYNGMSMSIAFGAIEAAGLTSTRLIGFDSFEGMPPGDDQDDAGVFTGGQLYFDEAAARANMRRHGVDLDRVVLVKGWYDDTLNDATIARLGLKRTSLVMIDCVIYPSTIAVLRFVEPLIGDSAVLIFDDWARRDTHLNNQGQKRAFDEFLAAHPELTTVDLSEFPPHAKLFEVRRT
ncbi:MAG TPA: TylF/MycF/NovP-related O-methyltransferase [Geminicoccaceae bacterium]|nr:TylF/MycF/NovP-related O-methyltransferase [Geminicoccus sp.]HMU49098.1 TylF/MycF/NovP-related O-methyltransferase [Geminicoccaceae bacterium]